jgi:hypothetical protein
LYLDTAFYLIRCGPLVGLGVAQHSLVLHTFHKEYHFLNSKSQKKLNLTNYIYKIINIYKIK